MNKYFKSKKLLLLSFSLIFSLSAYSQSKFSISGYVKDKTSGEDLVGASIGINETGGGTVSNVYGYYTISLSEGNYTLKVNYIGYKEEEIKVALKKDQRINIQLTPQSTELKAIEINANAPRNVIERTQMSKIDLPISQVKQLPALFGEVDVLKTIQLLPGVQSGGEGSTGFYVRGGGPDQNLIVLDEATVYNASHLFGFFSVFNADAIRNVELYKGGFPANFGGRLSSVVDINLKEGNNQKFSGAGGIGLIASRLTLEGPLVKDKSSFIISGRRTYFDVFTGAYNKIKEKKVKDYNPIPGYFFYDLNAKVNYELGARDRLFLSGYLGKDAFGFNRKNINFNFDWGNITTTARWNHVFTPKLFLNTTATFTNYDYNIESKLDVLDFSIGSQIKDYTLKTDFDFIPNEKHYVKFGALATYHDFNVGRFQLKTSDEALNFNEKTLLHATELGLYISDDWKINEPLKITYGFRLSGFQSQDTFYKGIEPRLSARYKTGKNASVKLSYTMMNQYIQLVSNSGTSLPTDFWYPANKIVKPQHAQQIAAGYSHILGSQILISDEVFYKWMRNQVDLRNNAQIFLNPNLDQEFVFGDGWSYGNELYIEKKQGKLTGWIGYTLAWSFRKFPDINGGETFFPKYDRRHDVNIVASYQLNERITLSATWVYSTGDLATISGDYVYFNGVRGSNSMLVPVSDKRNNYRMNAYHRMDFSMVYNFKPRWGKSDITFSVYNLYNQMNPYFIYIDQTTSTDNNLSLPTGAKAHQVSLFPVIPSVTYNFKF